MIRTAVVLAGGRGTRMQGTELDVAAQPLSADQERAAGLGQKAMMPVRRPFLDYVISALADAGITEVCIVVARSDTVIRPYYGRDLPPSRVQMTFAEQAEPRGTADALRCARACTGGKPFLVLNGDNYYPPAAIRALRDIDGPGLVAFEASALVRLGNIPASRLGAFALVRTDANGVLTDIIEKPGSAALADDALVSMNLWSFPPAIFDACDRIGVSSRGELEIADAVSYAQRHLGVAFRVVPSALGVLDLSTRHDVASAADQLRGVEVRL